METISEKNICIEENFNFLFKTHAKTIRNFIYYKCGNKDQAIDIVQEAYIKLWENCKKIFFSKAKSFLYTTSNNLFLNEVAHQKVILKYQNQNSTNFNNQNPEYLMEEQEYLKKLQNAITNLPEDQRTAFLLNRIDGKKYREIAEMLDISIKTVEKRISGALRNLRKDITEI